MNSLFERSEFWISRFEFSGFSARSNKCGRIQSNTADSLGNPPIRPYSAAATSFGFPVAADTMKSEMRGTISDLNREPLKTP
jgi:hypothetical protein